MHYENLKNQASSHNKFIQFKKFIEILNLSYDELIKIDDKYNSIFNDNLNLYNNILDLLELCKTNNIDCFLLKELKYN